MANQKHIKLLKQGVERWNEWRGQHQEIQPDLSNADLRGIDLGGPRLRVDLSDADLRGINLSGADLYGAHLNGADLRGAHLSFVTMCIAQLKDASLRHANLDRANLNGADLSGADLNGANLSGIILVGAQLHGADLSKANWSGATLHGADLSEVNLQGTKTSSTIFAEIDLRAVKGLAEINHQGPSRVELYTVQLPQDGTALHFLRGAGVPNEWIDLWRATAMHPVQYHSLFISYSSKDDALARRLHADLQDHGVRCWFAPEDMKIGDKIRTRIDEAIHLQDKLLLLLSEHALTSNWVEDEVEAALEKEQRQQREVLFPVHLDESVMQTDQAWAAKLRRTRYIGDFTNWTNPQAYQQAFKRLLRDLKKVDERQDQETKQ